MLEVKYFGSFLKEHNKHQCIVTFRRPHQGSGEICWVQKSDTDTIFDELAALPKQQNGCELQNISRDTVYDIITSGEEDLLDISNKWRPNRNKMKKPVQERNFGNYKRDSSVNKRKFFQTRTPQLATRMKKSEIQSRSKFGSYTRDTSFHESSTTSRNSSVQWKHTNPKFYYPKIISDTSSDEDDALFEVKSDMKRISYQHLATYNPQRKLADQMHKKASRRREFIKKYYLQRKDHRKSDPPKEKSQKYYLQRKDRTKSDPPKEKSSKPLVDKMQNNDLQLRKIRSSHSVKYSLHKFQESNSRSSDRISSTKEVNRVETLQSNVQKQILFVKNKVFSERKVQIASARKKNQEMVPSTKHNDLLPEMSHVRKLDNQNQARREIEYIRAVPEDELSTPDLNLLCSCEENDVQGQLLLNKSLLHTEEVNHLRTTKALTLLSSNEEPAIPFSLSEDNDSEISHITSPPVSSSTFSHSHLPEICFSPSPIKSPAEVDKSSASGNKFEMHTNNLHILPSVLLHNIQNERGSLRRIKLMQKKEKNSAEMGFPNPIGTNKCWMNSSLQVIFGMKPFIDDTVNIFEKSNIVDPGEKYSLLMEKFIGVVRARQRRNQLQLHRNLELLYQSLGVLNEHFTTQSQEDAVEFLTEFFSALREEFRRLCHDEVRAALANKGRQQHSSGNINDMNNCRQDKSNIQQRNPVDENIIFKLKEIHSCVMCSEHNSKETEHMTLIVNIPSEASTEITLQEALERSMVTETRELRCVKCNSQQCRVMTVFTFLPRFLILHVNRFKVQNNVIKKVRNYMKIPITLTVENVISKTETLMPLKWTSANHERFSWSKESKMNSCPPQNNNEGKKFQCSMEDPNVVKNKLEYALIGILSHKGDTPNSGHYEADVYNVMTGKWNHYNDEIVTNEIEEKITGSSRQENGYGFLYMYKPLFSQLVNERTVSRNSENQ
ncbi:Ubiquitin carboxyl-terminal hydrolase 37 [Zootermopsis nevadensis]|uniref:Ubiquitin carboxyl-terminal hydrolase 37 n=1 Tax=Zootermopsis nevadensis TaxID=136037 RepID=A0A067QUL5_ZOONE|nr:Ubiquitin carboxyl-terminal hydrolase 37 [Zootermopsis nevadensis]